MAKPLMSFVTRLIALLVAISFPTIGVAQTTQPHLPHQYWAYIGNNSNDGIALFKLDADAGTLAPAGVAAAASAPGFLAISPNQKFLFAAITNKTSAATIGAVEAFSIDPANGKLTAINQQPSGGTASTFVTVDPSGRNVLVANYGSATLSVLPIDSAGRLSPASCTIQEVGSSIDPLRQTHAYTHSVNCDPAGKFAITCDLGADKLFVYKFDPIAGTLAANNPPSVSIHPGSGPRHLTFSPDGKFVYMISEMGGTVTVFSFDADKGTMTQIQSATTLKEEVKGNASAEVQIDPAGKFLYASNRLSTNYLAIFSIDEKTGKLTSVGYQDSLGKTPRNFRIDPTGRDLLLANQDSNTLVLFAIDSLTGQLSPVGKPIATVKGPTCVKFVAMSP